MLRRTYEIEEKKLYVENFKASNKSMTEYARENDIPPSTFKEWIQEDKNLSFGAIELKSSTASLPRVAKSATVFATENIRIELKENFDKDLLKKIVEVLINDN